MMGKKSLGSHVKTSTQFWVFKPLLKEIEGKYIYLQIAVFV